MNVLIVVAHPDDEVLGCGGAMARHSAFHDQVFGAILTEGIMARSMKTDDTAYMNEKKQLKEYSQKAAVLLGCKEIVYFDFPDNRMDRVDLLDVIKKIEECINRFCPDIIYTHHSGDLNIDHAIVARAVLTATRPLPGCRVREVYAFEVLSATEWSFGLGADYFKPNYFINISDYLEIKMKALSVYQNEIRSFPHPRSIESIKALALNRGSQSGFPAAEAFQLIRKIQK